MAALGDDLFARAAPSCACGEPVQRVEIPWRLTGGGEWWPGQAVMVCGNGHRTPVEPL